MLKANFKTAFFITLTASLLLILGCGTPEENKADKIKEAIHLSESGSHDEALGILEELSLQYSNDIKILDLMGQFYTAKGDHKMAAFFLEQAHLLAPEDNVVLYKTYISLVSAEQDARHLLEKIAKQTPASMNAELWVRLGQNRQAENKVQPALDAYLKSVDLDPAMSTPQTAATIGQLFAKLGNLPQAETWLEIAADNDDPEALTALFGLLELKLRQNNWVGAESTIKELDEKFPGAVEASQWQQARQELIQWRNSLNKMKAKLAKAEALKRATEATTTNTDSPEAQNEKSALDPTATESLNTASNAKGKAQVIADMEAAEAMANTPAIEISDSEGNENEAALVDSTNSEQDQANSLAPEALSEPANSDLTLETENIANTPPEPTSDALDNSLITESVAEEPSIAVELSQQEPEPVLPIESPRTIEELLADAETAEIDRNFKSAIRKYWAAISISKDRADIWNLLSRAYLVDGQLENAETSALESVRLNPSKATYTLDYLRVAQRSKSTDSFLSELQTAYDRFPDSPEISLSLARAYERITKDNFTARNLYLRFIDIAPNHPLVPEAQAAANRLR